MVKFNGNHTNHFEDISQDVLRPSELVHQYGNLYSESRMEALDALDKIPQLGDMSVLKEKILFSVVVVSIQACYIKTFECVCIYSQDGNSNYSFEF